MKAYIVTIKSIIGCEGECEGNENLAVFLDIDNAKEYAEFSKKNIDFKKYYGGSIEIEIVPLSPSKTI